MDSVNTVDHSALDFQSVVVAVMSLRLSSFGPRQPRKMGRKTVIKEMTKRGLDRETSPKSAAKPEVPLGTTAAAAKTQS